MVNKKEYPHSLRCETCDHDGQLECPMPVFETDSEEYPGIKREDINLCQFVVRNYINKIGCASHSEAARTATLAAYEELKKDLKTRFVSSNNQWCKGRNSGLIECCNIIDEHADPLRQSTTGKQQEQE